MSEEKKENPNELICKYKISDLKEIDFVYQEILKINENKSYLEYLMKLFDLEKVKNEIIDCKKQILKEESLRETKKQAIKEAINKAKHQINKNLDKNEHIIDVKKLKVSQNNSKIVLELFVSVCEDITDYASVEEN